MSEMVKFQLLIYIAAGFLSDIAFGDGGYQRFIIHPKILLHSAANIAIFYRN